MAYRSSDEIIKRMIFRKLYNRMSDKGRLAVFISTIAACVVGLVVLTVGCIMMKNSNDLRVPMMIAVIGFVLAGLGIFFGSFVSDAAHYRSRSGVYGDAFAERSIDPSTAEGIAMAKDMNKQKASQFTIEKYIILPHPHSIKLGLFLGILKSSSLAIFQLKS